MPVHDWTQVSDGTFHDFHYSWVLEIKRALKRGLLPKGYYVMAEQLGGDLGAPDVLTLKATGTKPECEGPLAGTATLTETPPLSMPERPLPGIPTPVCSEPSLFDTRAGTGSWP